MGVLAAPSLTTIFDPATGKPLPGARIYYFDAGTTTPKTVYADSDLGTPHTSPVVANGIGMVPPVYVGVGNFKFRIVTPGGVQLAEVDGVQGEVTPGGGGGGPVDPNSVMITGDAVWSYRSGTRAGFVRGNGRTIGSATSGANERANADCQALFEFLWTQDATLVVSGGRGASANADWLANKTIALPDMRGRAPYGLDDMGNSAASVAQVSAGHTISTTNGSPTITVSSAVSLAIGMAIAANNVPPGTTITAISGTTVTMSANATGTGSGISARFSFFRDAQAVGAKGGTITKSLTDNELPSHTHVASASLAGGHTHAVSSGPAGDHTHSVQQVGFLVQNTSTAVAGAGTTSINALSVSPTLNNSGNHQHQIFCDTVPDHGHTISVDAVGQGRPTQIQAPGIMGTWFLKL